MYTDSNIGLTFDDFQQAGHQILPFDLNPYEIGIAARSNGVVTLNAQWPENMFDDHYIMIFYILWDNIISIDERRNIILDYIA